MTLTIDQLGVRFGQREALGPVSWSFATGKVTTILGPNAAGKSTLLRCLIGAQRPTVGSVHLDGHRVHELPPRTIAQRMAYVSQQPAALSGFTVREVVEFGRFIRGKNAEVVRESLERFELLDHAERAVHELSVGQQQRVALARAVAQLDANGHLILDEPTSAMDLRHAQQVTAWLRELASKGVTVIVAMHDLLAASALADEVILLAEGRIITGGTADDVLRPAHLESAFGVPFVELAGDDGRRIVLPSRTTPAKHR